MAGHSKWANIKHRKARQDSKRSRIWSKCSKAIIVAAKQGGGDPDTNLSLRYAIEEAKAANMPKDTIQKAVDKGSGEDDSTNYEEVVYEGYGPGGAAIMLDVLTDNKNRTVPEIRKIFENHSGNLGASGCVAYNFTSRGQILIPREPEPDPDAKKGTPPPVPPTEEGVMDAALEAGAEDVTDLGDAWQVLTVPSDLLEVRDALKVAGVPIVSATVTMIPQASVDVTGRDAQKLTNLLEALEDHDDVQHVHTNAEVAEEAVA